MAGPFDPSEFQNPSHVAGVLFQLKMDYMRSLDDGRSRPTQRARVKTWLNAARQAASSITSGPEAAEIRESLAEAERYAAAQQ